MEFESSLPLSSSIFRSLRGSLEDMALLDGVSLNRGRTKWLKRMMGQIIATTKATKYSNFCPCFEMSKVLTRYIQVPKYPTRYNPSPYQQSEKLAIVADTFPFFFWLNGWAKKLIHTNVTDAHHLLEKFECLISAKSGYSCSYKYFIELSG